MKTRIPSIVLLLPLTLLAFAGNSRAQQATTAVPPQTQTEEPQTASARPASTTPSASASEDAQILADSQRLFQLAAELKLDLINSPPGALSVSVIKKAAEVEQLARSLNQRMKNN